MKKKVLQIGLILLSVVLLTACSDSGDGTPSSSTASDNSNTVLETEAATEAVKADLSGTEGLWTYGKDIIFNASDGNRYSLTESDSGTVQSKDGKKYSIQECDYKLYAVMNFQEDKLTVREGRYSADLLNSKDYPDGYKTMVITYTKSDLFETDKLEEALKNPENQTEETTLSETISVIEETFSVVEETVSETLPETAADTETETEQPSVSSTEETLSADDVQTHENAEYGAIYKKIEAFLETDNFKQKDPGNRALEVFNYLHNEADANIQQDSITNDTAKNEVSFQCYEKYKIIINTEDSTIRIEES